MSEKIVLQIPVVDDENITFFQAVNGTDMVTVAVESRLGYDYDIDVLTNRLNEELKDARRIFYLEKSLAKHNVPSPLQVAQEINDVLKNG